jgi:hypothetical protein
MFAHELFSVLIILAVITAGTLTASRIQASPLEPTLQGDIRPRAVVSARVFILGNIITAAAVYALFYAFAPVN